MRRESIEQTFAIYYAKAMSEMRSPKQIRKKELFKRVILAAKSTGIESIVIHEWDQNLMQNSSTDGALRENKYFSRNPMYDNNIDIGYFVKKNGSYNIRSFHINGFVFSNEMYIKFFHELEKRRLIPQAHVEFGTIFPTEAEIKKWETRKPIYK